MNLKSLIRTVPNYPKPGILFRDITTILYNGKAFKYISDIYFNRYKDKNITAIAGIEARGFIFGAIISFYHVGIEQEFFKESFVCNLDSAKDALSAEQLLKQLENAPISCKDVTFRFLGLSLATINTIISILLSGIMFKVIRNYGQNK